MDDRNEGTGLVMSEERTLRWLVDTLSWRGGRMAVVALREEGVERWSYLELSDNVRRLGRGLRWAGVERGDHVAIFAGNRPEWVVACLAVIHAGAIVVPLDAQLDDAALGRIIDDSGTRFIFTTADRAERVERLDLDDGPRSILLDAGEGDERSWRLLLADDEVELPRVEPGDPAALFYTSGTTGTAKGVPLSHRNLVFQIDALLGADLVSEDDSILLPLPLHHVYPFVMGMLTPLAAEVPIVMPQSLTGPQLVRALQEGEVTLIIGVPRLYGALYSGIEERIKSSGRVAAALFGAGIQFCVRLRRRTGFDVGKVPLRPLRERFGPRLRVLASGGAALDPDLAWKLEGMGWRVAVGYGLTETAPLLTLNPPDGEKLGSVGRPVPGVEISVDPSAVPDESQRRLDGKLRREGEILARGPNVFSGYRNRPEETSKVFTDDGWFRTGDLGYFDDDGYLYVTGRASTLIVTASGKNIQPEDVEGAYQENPYIREVGVLQKDGRLVALIVPDIVQIRRLGDGDIQQSIREAVEEGSKRLPSYQRISDYAVSREPLEYTRLGKLRRHVLDERYERAKRGKESQDEAATGPIAVEEMSEADRVLMGNPAAATVWDLLANRYPDRGLTPESSPQLDLDIDSLGWINLTLEIAEKAGVDLDEEAIQHIDTVRDLLREVAREAEAGGTEVHTSPLARPEEVLNDRQKRWLAPLGPAASALAGGMFTLNRMLMRGPFRLRVEGLENLPDEGPFIAAPNHVSYLDSFAVAAALDDRVLRRTYWAGWTGAAFGNPLTRLVSRLAQVVPVDPDRAGLSSLAFGAAVLKRGRNLVWFAEGERSPTGRLQQFKPGMGILLNYYSVPVVPVFISGTYEAMPRGKFLRRLEQVTVTFGEPLVAGDLETASSQQEVVQAVRERVAKLANTSDSRRDAS
ncbi:MAG TPA: AMP-binding protein [Rubrobacter sp.]|nr:AMP-binding protein [Rubrobacter sp.]